MFSNNYQSTRQVKSGPSGDLMFHMSHEKVRNGHVPKSDRMAIINFRVL
jgi:hypothetical protein